MLKKVLAVLGLSVLAAAAFALRTDRPAAEVDSRYRTRLSRFAVFPDGTRMHYLEAGTPGAPVLILVHGSFDSAFTWERIIPLLARDFHVIAPDLPAHGLTGRTARHRYGMDDMVRALHDLVTQLDLPSFGLAGNSMGGNASWLYAHAHPERVERLVLIDAAGYPHDNEPLVPEDENPVWRFLYLNGNPSIMVRKGYNRAVADRRAISDAYIARAVDFLRRRGSREAQWLRNRARRIHQQPFARIAEITTPTLIVWGNRDELLPVSSAQRFHEDLPNSELVLYAGIGHMPQLEDPERLADDLREFLLRSRRAGMAPGPALARDIAAP